ncbi:hypothetical protein HK101_006779, partial [Irineochytrium annulatum]
MAMLIILAYRTLRESLDVVRAEIEASARAHLDISNQIRNELEKPMSEFQAKQSGIRKNHAATMEKHLKLKSNTTASVQKSKERYEQKCIEYNQLMSSKPGLPPKELEKVRREHDGGTARERDEQEGLERNGPRGMVGEQRSYTGEDGKEIEFRKLVKLKIEKTSNQMKQNDLDYLNGVEKLADIHQRWEEDMRIACKECQKLEEERIDYIRSTVWNYANMLSSLCVSDDESCERIRTSLEKCNIERDISTFLDSYATGSEIPQPTPYVNFYTRTSERPLTAAPKLDSYSKSSRSNSVDIPSQDGGGGGGGGFWGGSGGSSTPTAVKSVTDSSSRGGSGTYNGYGGATNGDHGAGAASA